MSTAKHGPRLPASRQTKPMATVALFGFAYFLVAVAALYLLNPGYTLFRSFTAMGDYDIGPHKFLIASTYFGLGLGSLALALALHQGMARSALATLGLLLLGMWGVGMFAAGIFPTDSPGSTVTHTTSVLLAGIFPVTVQGNPDTKYGWLHVFINYGSFLGLTLAALLLSRRFKTDERWLPFQRPALILAAAMLAACLWIVFEIFLAFRIGFEPAAFRILIVTSLLWLFLTAARLRLVVVPSMSE